MKIFPAAALTIFVTAFAACVPTKPMTVSEFKGYCYQGGASMRMDSCDTIGVCNEYLVVVNDRQKSLDTCLQGCADVLRQQKGFYGVGECPREMANGSDWCERYCRRAFAK